MKIVFRIFGILILLGALAAAGWGGYWYYIHRSVTAGGAGRNMEVRLLARVGTAAQPPATSTAAGDPQAGAAQPQDPIADADLLSADAVHSYADSGDAPAGWEWLPVADGVEREVTNSAMANTDGEYVTRANNGQTFLLTADTPDTALTHASGSRSWGVDSVKVVDDGMGPAVQIHLDKQGGELMHAFTEKYVGHRIAVVVGGVICQVALIQNPVRSTIVVRLPAGQQAQAESLRDSLMK
jgi:preprotein translocase subunit SecD